MVTVKKFGKEFQKVGEHSKIENFVKQLAILSSSANLERMSKTMEAVHADVRKKLNPATVQIIIQHGN